MKRQSSISGTIFDIFNTFIMVIIVIITLYPIVFIAFASLSLPLELAQHRGVLLSPIGFTLDSYKLVFQNPLIATGYKNTLILVIAGTFINIAMTSLAAYALSRKDLYLRVPITLAIIFTMYFSGGLIPTYLQVSKLHMLDTLWAVLLPTAMSAFYFLLMRTAFESVPVSMEESARMDGANDFIILFRIVLPLSLPTLAVMILFYGVGQWNSYFNAMVYIRKPEMFPLQLVLRDILVNNNVDNMTTEVGGADKPFVAMTVKYATIIVATIPVLFIYPFLQRYFVKGIMLGAVKG